MGTMWGMLIDGYYLESGFIVVDLDPDINDGAP